MPAEAIRDTFPGMFWGYFFIWILICIYIFTLGRRLSTLEGKLQSKDAHDSPENK